MQEGDTQSRQLSGQDKRDRRLYDKLMAAFESACDVREIAVATRLLELLEVISNKSFDEEHDRRESLDILVEAYHRLWNVKNTNHNLQ